MAAAQRGTARRPKTKRERLLETADNNGVFSAKRYVHSSSFSVFGGVVEELGCRDEVATVKDLDKLAMTLIGRSRFTRSHLEHGPPTGSVLYKIKNIGQPQEVRLGRIGVYGDAYSGAGKLAFELLPVLAASDVESDGPDPKEEILACEDAFKSGGYQLNPDPNRGHGPVAHLTVAELTPEGAAAFKNRDQLAKLDSTLDVGGFAILLAWATLGNRHEPIGRQV